MGTQGEPKERKTTHTINNNRTIETPESQKQPIHNNTPLFQSTKQIPNYPSSLISKKNPQPLIVMGIPNPIISISIKKGYL